MLIVETKGIEAIFADGIVEDFDRKIKDVRVQHIIPMPTSNPFGGDLAIIDHEQHPQVWLKLTKYPLPNPFPPPTTLTYIHVYAVAPKGKTQRRFLEMVTTTLGPTDLKKYFEERARAAASQTSLEHIKRNFQMGDEQIYRNLQDLINIYLSQG